MQLTNAPEGKSSLHIRLNEAEKRAQQAEMTAQDAQATLARTLLEAARVEAVVTARVKAESEAEIEALKAQLGAAKRVTTAQDRPLEEVRGCAAGSEGKPVLKSPGPVGPIVLTEWDRPPDLADDPEDAPAAEILAARKSAIPVPMRLALLAVIFIVSVVSYSLTVRYMVEHALGPSATSAPAVASSMAVADPRAENVVASTARIAPPAAQANWLLYMPVEPAAVAAYLGGPTRSKKQLAVKSSPTVNQ